MPVDTRTLPGILRSGKDGDEVARGWCLVTFEAVGQHLPLNEWRGEMAVDTAGMDAVSAAGGDLYIYFRPYGGVYEPWHGPVKADPVDAEFDPNRRRLRLTAAGPLVRSRYEPHELEHGFPQETAAGDEAETAAARR